MKLNIGMTLDRIDPIIKAWNIANENNLGKKIRASEDAFLTKFLVVMQKCLDSRKFKEVVKDNEKHVCIEVDFKSIETMMRQSAGTAKRAIKPLLEAGILKEIKFVSLRNGARAENYYQRIGIRPHLLCLYDQKMPTPSAAPP